MPEESRKLTLGRFELLRLVGEGGMGIVYEALDPTTGRSVALKVLRHMDRKSCAYFKREFRALASLRHPNLVVLHELFEAERQLFFTMDLLHGKSFLDFVRDDAVMPSQSAVTLRRVPAAAPPAPVKATFRQEPTRPATGEALERLRHAMAQLVAALKVLHSNGLVHRDVKPSNIVVEQQHLTLLDFGLVTSFDVEQSTSRHLVGTSAYMAPEQAAGGAVGPEADWYAVGVLLFQALTRALPFEGAPIDVIIAKRSRAAPSPRAFVDGLPDDLVGLCERLLLRDPSARRLEPFSLAPGSYISRVVEPDRSASRTSQVSRVAAAPPFVGRSGERAWLGEHWARVEAGESVLVSVSGESGIGKTALVANLVREVSARGGQKVAALDGRCYERETIHYKGIDGVVESLAKFLRGLPHDEMARLIPRHAAQLVQLFPEFLSIEQLASAARDARPMSAQRARAYGVAALREVLLRLGDRYDVVVHLDDLQWIDADGKAVLDDILRQPDAPRLLWIATSTPSAGAPDVVASLRTPSQTLVVGPLQRSDATALLSELAQRQGVALSSQELESLAGEAYGNPIYLHELARQAAVLQSQRGAPIPSLADVIGRRIAQLEPKQRELLELACVAETPLSRSQLALACALELASTEDGVVELTSQRLLLSSGSAAGSRLQPSHDRVRKAVLHAIDDARFVKLHWQLATALERALPLDHESLATHWLSAGEPERAQPHLAVAARLAAAAFAFERAAELYRLALQGARDQAEREMLRSALGEALANAGRGAEAADALLEAAELAQDADSAQQLKRRAVEQLLRAGHIDRGMDVLRPVLEAVQLGLPRGPKASLLSLLYHRARLAMRGLDYELKTETDVEPAVLHRLDVCWSAATGIGLVDMIRGSDFQTRSLLLALDAGEPGRLSRALANEAAVAASEGVKSRRRVPVLFGMAERLAARTPRPDVGAWLVLCRGIAAMQEGAFEESLDFASRAETLFSRDCVGATWEVVSCQAFGLWALAYQGRLREIERRLPALVASYGDRGDLFAQSNVKSGPLHVLGLARDDVASVREGCEGVLSRWAQTGFHFQHMSALFSLVMADMYCGDSASAMQRLTKAWPEVERSLLLRVQFFKIDLWYLRGRVALARALSGGEQVAKHVTLVKQAIKNIESENMGWSRGMGPALRAGLACVARDMPAATTLLDEARSAFARANMNGHAAACSLQMGLLGAHDAGGRVTLASEGVQNPDRFANVLIPCRLLVSGS